MKKRSDLNEIMPQTDMDSLQAFKENAKEKDKALSRLLIPSILSMFLCMACLFSMTWAWFSDSTQADSSRIVAGSYEVKVAVKDAFAANVALDADGKATLPAGTYQITFTAYGTGDPDFGGYGIVLMSDAAAGQTENTTSQISVFTKLLKNGKPGQEITVTLTLAEATAVDFNSCWGVPPSKEGDIRLEAGDTLTVAADGTLTVTPATNTGSETTQSAETTVAP